MENGEIPSQSTTPLQFHTYNPREGRRKLREHYLPLYRAILNNQWEAAQRVIDNDPAVLRAYISEGKETALHIAASMKNIPFVEKLVARMHEEDLEIQNARGNTALCFAAADGNKKIAELMIAKNDRLPNIFGLEGMRPVSMAASLGHKEMVDCLLPLSNIACWSREEQAKLLTTCIVSGLCDVALKIISKDTKLIAAKDSNGETALHVLARTPSAFAGGKQQGIWRIIINSCLCMKEVQHGNSQQYHAFKLLKFILEHVLWQEDNEILQLITDTPKLLFVAADLGNAEFLIALMNSNPDLIWKIDDHHKSVFHIAVLRRHQDIFNLLHEIGSIGSLIATYRDDADNNMLHLAAKLAPPDQLNNVSGAALQMQRDLLWYKEVEKRVQPLYRCMKNKKGETPQQIFSMEHKELMMKGEAWMKSTASSCMVVATLIATVIFTAAFTVPGGNDSRTGAPLLLPTPFFKVFAISESIAMFSSSTSILMFLSILTSRYGERDFLHSLPFMLMIGITTLFVSVAAMLVAFCTTIALSCQYPGPILLGIFSLVPVIFIRIKIPLLVDIICSTYDSRFLFRSYNRLFQQSPC